LLFAVMFLWQVPHFLAITLFRREEYARAGLVVQPNEPGGEPEARRNIVRYSVALVAVSLLFVPLGIGRGFYFATALLSGLLFLGPAASTPPFGSKLRRVPKSSPVSFSILATGTW